MFSTAFFPLPNPLLAGRRPRLDVESDFVSFLFFVAVGVTAEPEALRLLGLLLVVGSTDSVAVAMTVGIYQLEVL